MNFIEFFKQGPVYLKGRIYEVKLLLSLMFLGLPVSKTAADRTSRLYCIWDSLYLKPQTVLQDYIVQEI